jgi:hypothetical protein
MSSYFEMGTDSLEYLNKYCGYLPLAFKAGEVTTNTIIYNAGSYTDGVSDSLMCLGLALLGYGYSKLYDRFTKK